MGWKKIIIIGIILAIVSWVIFFMSLFLIDGGVGSLGGGMIAIGAGYFIFQIWTIFTLFFVPIATYFIFKKFGSTQPNPIEIFSTTIFCFLLISIPFMYILVIEHLEEIKLEKSYEVTDEFAEAYNLAIEKMDPTICDKLKSKTWIEKEGQVDYNNENARTYERCCFYSSNAIIFDKDISEEEKWGFCMKISGYPERQGCYSGTLEIINQDKRLYPINLKCDLIKDDIIKKECLVIDERIKAEEKAYNSDNLSACNLTDSFQKAVCYSFVAYTRPLCSNVCDLLSSEIIIVRKLFQYSRKETQKEVCEFYCKERKRRKTMN